MAIASVGAHGSRTNKAATTNWTTAAAGATIPVDTVLLISLATDNITTTDGNSNDHLTLTDSVGNVYTKVREYTNGQTAAAAGVTVSVWFSKLTVEIVNAVDTWTVGFPSNVVSKAMGIWRFSVGAGNTLQFEDGADLANDGADTGSIALSSLANIEHLFWRVIGFEDPSTTAITVTSGYTAGSGNQTAAGGAATNIAIRNEFRIQTTTSTTSDPTSGGGAVDHASTLVSLKEVSASVDATVAPGVIGATVSAPSTALSAGATQSPSVISSTAALPQALSLLSTTVLPSSIACLLGVPQTGLSASSVSNAATLVLIAALPAATAGAATSITPNTIAVSTALDLASLLIGATRTPPTLAVTGALPQASPSLGQTAQPTTVGLVVALPQAAISITMDATVSPATIQAVAALLLATPGVSAEVTPNAIALLVAFEEAFSGLLRKLEWIAGQPQAKWLVNDPQAKWFSEDPETKWTAERVML